MDASLYGSSCCRRDLDMVTSSRWLRAPTIINTGLVSDTLTCLRLATMTDINNKQLDEVRRFHAHAAMSCVEQHQMRKELNASQRLIDVRSESRKLVVMNGCRKTIVGQ
jgi:hypothetical protein